MSKQTGTKKKKKKKTKTKNKPAHLYTEFKTKIVNYVKKFT